MDLRHVTSSHGGIHYNGVHHFENYNLGSNDMYLVDTINNNISIYDIYRLFELPIPEAPTTPKEYRKHLFSMYTTLFNKLQPNSNPIIGINTNLVKYVKLESEIKYKLEDKLFIDKDFEILTYRFTFDYLQRNIDLEGKKISWVIEDIISKTKMFSTKGYNILKDDFINILLWFENNNCIKLNKDKTHFGMVIPPNLTMKVLESEIIITIWKKYKIHLLRILMFEDAVRFLKRKEEHLEINICQQLIIHYLKCNLL